MAASQQSTPGRPDGCSWPSLRSVLARAADAQIYTYKDANGRTYFTDTPPHDGFSRYRSKSEYELRTAASHAVARQRQPADEAPTIPRSSAPRASTASRPRW